MFDGILPGTCVTNSAHKRGVADATSVRPIQLLGLFRPPTACALPFRPRDFGTFPWQLANEGTSLLARLEEHGFGAVAGRVVPARPRPHAFGGHCCGQDDPPPLTRKSPKCSGECTAFATDGGFTSLDAPIRGPFGSIPAHPDAIRGHADIAANRSTWRRSP